MLVCVAVPPADAMTPRNTVGVAAANENLMNGQLSTPHLPAARKVSKFYSNLSLVPGSNPGGYPSTISNTELSNAPRACNVQGDAKLVVVLVVCDERIDWIRRFGILDIKLIVTSAGKALTFPDDK